MRTVLLVIIQWTLPLSLMTIGHFTSVEERQAYEAQQIAKEQQEQKQTDALRNLGLYLHYQCQQSYQCQLEQKIKDDLQYERAYYDQ